MSALIVTCVFINKINILCFGTLYHVNADQNVGLQPCFLKLDTEAKSLILSQKLLNENKILFINMHKRLLCLNIIILQYITYVNKKKETKNK